MITDAAMNRDECVFAMVVCIIKGKFCSWRPNGTYLYSLSWLSSLPLSRQSTWRIGSRGVDWIGNVMLKWW